MTLSVDILLDRAIKERVAAALETQIAEDGADGFTVTYVFTVEDFGAGWTQDIQSPAGYRGKVVSVGLTDVTEAFVGTTSTGPVLVGEQGGDDNGYAFSEEPKATLSIADATENLGVLEGVIGVIPAADDILITGPINVGGAITGQATVSVTIKYFI